MSTLCVECVESIQLVDGILCIKEDEMKLNLNRNVTFPEYNL